MTPVHEAVGALATDASHPSIAASIFRWRYPAAVRGRRGRGGSVTRLKSSSVHKRMDARACGSAEGVFSSQTSGHGVGGGAALTLHLAAARGTEKRPSHA